ncbi:hypothetical protein Tco_0344504 [Tanacetum coccineum]
MDMCILHLSKVLTGLRLWPYQSLRVISGFAKVVPGGLTMVKAVRAWANVMDCRVYEASGNGSWCGGKGMLGGGRRTKLLTYMLDKYGYMKSHKKTVKNGQARTQERKSEQKPEAKARKSQIFSQLQITRGIEESTRDDGNYSGYTHRSNTKRHIMDCQLGNPCEIVCDPRATIHSPMIKEMIG